MDSAAQERFNSATTRRSWKGRRGLNLRLRAGASIRPRPGGRGKVAAPRRWLRGKPRFNSATTRRSWKVSKAIQTLGYGSWLQFGHDPEVVESCTHSSSSGTTAGFNSATTRRSWKARPLGRVLQHQRRFNSATTRRSWKAPGQPHEHRGRPRASIRPRPGGRGKKETLVRAVPRLHASIRPRPGGRGKRCRSPGTAEPTVLGFNSATTRRSWKGRRKAFPTAPVPALQFGHDPEVVERSRSRGGGRPSCPLQFGHDPEVVESPPTFSGRTSSSPLQFGHDPEVVESTSASAPNVVSAPVASIRPRPGGRGKR